MRSRGLSPVSINTHLRTLNAFFRWLHEEGHTDQRTAIPRLRELHTIIQALSAPQVRRLAAYRPQGKRERQIHTLACLILDTGLRIDEALSLDRNRDLDLDGLLLTVRDGKGGKGRIVPFSLPMRRLLFRHLKRFAPAHGSLVFFSGGGAKTEKVKYLKTRIQ